MCLTVTIRDINISGNELQSEKGRHMNIDRYYRYCNFCLKRNVYVIEDEFHVVLVWPLYDEIRLKYWMDIIRHNLYI